MHINQAINSFKISQFCRRFNEKASKTLLPEAFEDDEISYWL